MKNKFIRAKNVLLLPDFKHIFKIMKLILMLILFCVSSIFAENINSQTTRVTIHANRTQAKEVINLIEEQTDYLFVYNYDKVDLSWEVTMEASDTPVAEVLSGMFAGSDIIYAMEGNNILLLKKNATSEQQQIGKRISGTVVTQTGEAIIGASIVEKGTTNGNVTDIAGKFSLSVGENVVLRISYLGYVTQEITVGNQTSLNIILKEDNQILEEVIIVGYGTAKKVSLTGAVATLKPEDIQNIPAGNLTNALAGRISGVIIQSSDGAIPGESSSFQIRGRSTWHTGDDQSKNEPLFVIDGVVRDKFAFDGLNANEIEQFSVLKDASAAAVYGARAANGVVLVTTKRGKAGKPTISYSGSVGYNSPTMIPERETAYEHTVATNNYNMECIDYPAIYTTSIYTPQGKPINSNVFTPDEQEYYRTHSYDYLDATWKDPVLTTHSLNISGGNEYIRYFAGGTYYNEEGGFKSINYRKYSARTSIDANITKNLEASLSLNTNVRNNDLPVGTLKSSKDDNYGSDNLWYQMLIASPMRPYMVDGKYIGGDPGFNAMNIVARANGEDGYNIVKNTESEITASLSYDLPFIKGLNLKLLYNYYTRNQFDKEFGIPYQVYGLTMAGENNHIITDEFSGAVTTVRSPGYLSEKYTPAFSYQANFLANYARTFGRHDIDVLLGYEQVESNMEWFSAKKNEYQIFTNPYFNAGPSSTSTFAIDGKGSEDGRLSYIGRVKYGFDNRYLLDLSFRSDASSKFDPAHRWGFFPAASAAWRISEESFFKDKVAFMNNLKLRASAGLTGNDNVGAYQWMETATLVDKDGKQLTGAYFGGITSALAPGVIANPFITWEKSLIYEAGVDMGFLKNMITFGASYYFKHTYDILGTTTKILPDTFGGTLADENYGIIDSQGIEFELGFNHAIGRDARVWLNGNFGYYTNKVIEMKEASGLLPHLSKVGLNFDREYDYIYDKMIRSMADVEAYQAYASQYGQSDFFAGMNLSGKYLAHPGMLAYKDLRGGGVNGDEPNGMIDAGDIDKDWIITHSEPPISYGFKLGGSWKGFSLEAFFQGLAGYQKWIRKAQTVWYEPLRWANWGFYSKDHFSQANPDAAWPSITNWGGWNSRSSFWVRDASFLRLKNVNLAYTFPQSILSKSGLSGLSAYINATNLFFLEDHIKIFDAEINSIGAYPMMRSVTFGLNISF
jgi:TonB-linked SusC/RagA family outer membrane protein